MFKVYKVKNIGPVLSITIRNKTFYLCFCHRRKDRTIHIFGLGKYLCARCQGLLIGMAFGIMLRLLGLRFSLIISLIFVSPLLIDGFTQLFKYRESNNILRFITGFLASVGIICCNMSLNFWKYLKNIIIHTLLSNIYREFTFPFLYSKYYIRKRMDETVQEVRKIVELVLILLFTAMFHRVRKIKVKITVN